ncbi:MAG: recombinase family protein [Oscillospiraceae bacterium]|nr:recombinase family protein [Oscillospiraceae bacterium]
MPKVGIYCRLSIEDQDKNNADSISIQNQKAMLSEYCRERNWDIYEIYIDDGYSGTDRNRPAFNRLLRDCEAGNVDIVLCKDQSRFSRDTLISEMYLNDKFLEWGVRFIGLADNADTDSESFGTMRLFTSAYNEMYVKDISSKIRRTLAYKREQGQFVGSFAPYGYRIDPDDRHHLIADPETVPVVQMIFDLYVQGEGYRHIVQRLNAEGIASPSAYKRQHGSNYTNSNAENSSAGGLWTLSTVVKILANEVYTGTLVQGKSHHVSYKNRKRRKVDPADWVRIPNAHEAIICAETWARAQERLHSRARVGSRMQELPPLSGKVRCAVCGRPMKRNVYYNKSKTIKYYGLQCASYKTGAMNCPNAKTMSGMVLEETILAELNRIVGQYCQSDEIRFTNLYEEQLTVLENSLAKLNEKQTAAQNRLVQMYKDKLDGLLSEADYSLFRQHLTEEEQEIARRMKEIKRQIKDTREQMKQAAGQQALPEQYMHFDILDRTVADEFLSYIEIGLTDETGQREIHIHWNI